MAANEARRYPGPTQLTNRNDIHDDPEAGFSSSYYSADSPPPCLYTSTLTQVPSPREFSNGGAFPHPAVPSAVGCGGGRKRAGDRDRTGDLVLGKHTL